ncbi:MAG: hypothetical protein KGJ89_01555 [Patescibacteria group bacterium]|nr:hypothetical protein [Patescibacteria group bacterium]MDE2015195.1 hypothetical protein [Patescibacteria group bacterium]MDE2226622.1 hypothetical protein [Patescibacteria group bacterium]
MEDFLGKIQSADESTKRRWIIICTIVIMVVILYVWLAYFNNLMASVSNQGENIADTSGSPAAARTSSGSTFLQSVKNSPAFIYNIFTNSISFLGGILQSPREYIVKPPQ